MKKLSSYRASPLFNITINYGGEAYKFNLAHELKIDEVLINKHIKNQPIDFSFLMMLHKKLLSEFEILKHKRKKTYGKLFLQAKDKLHNGRPYNDDMAKAWAESRKEFQSISKQCILCKDSADTIYTCVRAFEQRKDLLQTLSSNNRREKSYT